MGVKVARPGAGGLGPAHRTWLARGTDHTPGRRSKKERGANQESGPGTVTFQLDLDCRFRRYTHPSTVQYLWRPEAVRQKSTMIRKMIRLQYQENITVTFPPQVIVVRVTSPFLGALSSPVFGVDAAGVFSSKETVFHLLRVGCTPLA